jgi:magnesium transporter
VITIFKNGVDGFGQIETALPNSWVHVVEPSPEEIAQLSIQFHVPESFVAASLDVDELARTDQEEGCTLVIVLIPHVYSADPTDVPFSTIPLGIVLTGDHLLTICKIRTNFVSEFSRKHARHISTAKKNRLILQLLFAVAQQYLSYLRQIESQTDALQKKIQGSIRNKELLELLRFQKSFIYFRTSLESNGLMMNRLRRAQFFELYPDDLNLLEDVLTENMQATEVTKISGDILNQMMDTYASIISNNLNDVMKILALVTILLSIPTLVASIYGMNVPLPGEDSPTAMFVILGVAIGLATVVGLVFWRRRWL